MECGRDGIICRAVGVVREVQGVQRRGKLGLDVSHDDSLEALHDDGCECDGTVVIETRHRGLLRHGDDGGGLEACWDNGAAQRDVEDVCQDTCKLVKSMRDRQPRAPIHDASEAGCGLGSAAVLAVGKGVGAPFVIQLMTVDRAETEGRQRQSTEYGQGGDRAETEQSQNRERVETEQ
ncbi:hypothetical protein P4O66_012459 [Electrophorus voltai]|uniref:Uncharacterized protein n=1 Tax=Electrophorus voltai TaxID=2609070 RepID=A0AAD8Z3Z6_9TELE|nr:hypothetical protein P4O66_012459 [Electrophorus voltai]